MITPHPKVPLPPAVREVLKKSHGHSERRRKAVSEILRKHREIQRLQNSLSVTRSRSIAESCGFSDPLYFSTVFKKCVGTSPCEYRKKANEKG